MDSTPNPGFGLECGLHSKKAECPKAVILTKILFNIRARLVYEIVREGIAMINRGFGLMNRGFRLLKKSPALRVITEFLQYRAWRALGWKTINTEVKQYRAQSVLDSCCYYSTYSGFLGQHFKSWLAFSLKLLVA